MRPGFALDNRLDRAGGNPVAISQCLLSHDVGSVSRADLQYDGGGQHCSGMGFAGRAFACAGVTSLGYGIERVITLGAEPQMAGLGTRGVVTTMKHEQLGGDWAFVDHPRNSMRSVLSEPAVTVAISQPVPLPTSATLYSVAPESGFE